MSEKKLMAYKNKELCVNKGESMKVSNGAIEMIVEFCLYLMVSALML